MNETTGFDPRREAWLYSFLDENHLNHSTSPDLVASPAQVRFMVYLEPDQPYYPCSEKLFQEIMARVKSPMLGELYAQTWTRISRLVSAKIEDRARRDFLIDLLNIKHQHETANYNVIPSRVEKRLFKLFMVTTQIEDPMMEEKRACNRRALEIYKSEAFREAVNRPPEARAVESLESMRRHLDASKLRRLFQASVQTQLWAEPGRTPVREEWDRIFGRPVTGDGWAALENLLLAPCREVEGHYLRRTILYLADVCGNIVLDLAVIKLLVRMGHTVVLAVKSAAFYDYVYLGDVVNCPVLRELVEDVEVVAHQALSKNQLASYLKNDRRFKVITDGTMEKLNLILSSVTFARAFKEVDGVISRGLEQRGRFFDTVFEFTQDIYSLARDNDGNLSVLFKPVSPMVRHFSSSDLEDRAQAIVNQMRAAKDQNQTVMFYSGIVGSIPGETETAILVMTTFVNHLREQQAQTFVLNPSEYFVQGMDADDLMYMWEIVQRSGYIDIWRFQSVPDIEKSFELLGRKVPPQWVGKDSTFSTGCTKEMAIALDMQRRNPEMQIIGPDPEKFTRRGEYGIGMFHDTRLSEIYQH
ncbi:MAG: ARMT1-like domain-containing protein [Thermodesulfobacteriota bacterium]